MVRYRQAFRLWNSPAIGVADGGLDPGDGCHDVGLRHVSADIIVLIDNEYAWMLRVSLMQRLEVIWILRDEDQVIRDDIGEVNVVVCLVGPGIRWPNYRVPRSGEEVGE